jgi:hypothetical protein
MPERGRIETTRPSRFQTVCRGFANFPGFSGIAAARPAELHCREHRVCLAAQLELLK